MLSSSLARGGHASAEDADAFARAVYRTFTLAERAAGGPVNRWYRIAGQLVRLRFAGPALVPRIAPVFEHLAAAPGPTPALTVCLWDVESALPDVPAPPWRMQGDLTGWQIRRYNDEHLESDFDIATGVLSVRLADENLALYCTRDARQLPGWELGAPLKHIVHWALRGRGAQLVHAAAVGRSDGGVLLVGPGGSGKSTSALACLGSGLRHAADDHCLIATDPPVVHSLYNCVKIYPRDAGRFPLLDGARRIADAPGTDKMLVFLHPERGDCIIGEFPLRAVLVPTIGGSDTVVTPVSSGVALKALAPSTMFSLAGTGAPTLAALAACVRRVPCYALRLGPTFADVPKAILALLDRLPAAP